MTAPDTPEFRAELWHLVELAGLIVWSDTTGCGIRCSPDQEQVLDDCGDGVAVFRLAQNIHNAGAWAEGADRNEARLDAADLPGVAFNLATCLSPRGRRVLGEIITNHAVLSAWSNDRDALADAAVDTWIAEVRPLAFRLAVACRSNEVGGGRPKPWSSHA